MAHIQICGYGGTGRRTRLRIERFTAWGGDSRYPPPSKTVFNNSIASGSRSAVEHHLAKVGVAGSNPVFRPSLSRGGGTGRRTGLKILRDVIIVPVRFRSSAPY